MSSTKIINVLKDDSFQEILDLFKSTSAEEVIFVLPKRSRAFQKEDHFAVLQSEAKDLGKTVSFLCSSPELNDLAKKYRFDVLLARSPAPRKSVSKSAHPINVVNQIEDFYSEPATDEDMISIASAVTADESDDQLDFEEPAPRRLDDVVIPQRENQHGIKVFGKEEKSVAVGVNQSDFAFESLEHPMADEIKSVWASQVVSKKSWLPKSKISLPSHRVSVITMACGAIIVLGAVIFMTTGQARVTIKPSDQPLDARITVIASDNVSTVNPLNLAIPGQVFNIQKTVSQDFPATGHVDVAQKARGIITVYNELSVTQQLVATTRFASTDDHIFHTLTSIVVPAAKTSAGKLIPGNIDVQVVANKPGADYNVPVGLFTVVAFKEKGDTEKYKKIYAQSTTAMRNGTSGQATVVSDSDLTSAKQILTTNLTASIQDDLKSQINDLKIINDNQINFGQPTSGTPSNETKTFTANLSGSIKTVGFRQSDLDSLIIQYLDTKNNVTVVSDKLTLVYDNIHWDIAKGGLAFSVHITGPGYAKIDQNKIITDLLGKNDSQIKAYLGGIIGIYEAHVSLSPFWVRTIPRNQDRVKVDLSY